ncbi:abc1 protein at2g40090-like [Nannochloropsis oceanica]
MDPETNAWELSQAMLRGLRLGKTVVLVVADYKLSSYGWWDPTASTKAGGRGGGVAIAAAAAAAEVALLEAEREMRESQNAYEEVSWSLRKLQEQEEGQRGREESREQEQGGGWWRWMKRSTGSAAAVARKKKQVLVGKLEREAKEARERLLAAAARLSKVEEHAKGLSQKGRVHQRVADRLLELCQLNLGCYIKIGQHLSNLDYLLPREVTDTLKVLLNRAPVSSYEDVCAVIKEELGKTPAELWSSFDPVPIASASLAQVHIATDAAGRKLAVKVQHRGLRELSRGDVAAVSFFVNAVAKAFPEFSYKWIADELAPQLPKELDFVNEAMNAERADAFFKKHRNDVVIPAVVWEQTKPRVLTMAFEEGVCATDVTAMKNMGLPLDRVARLISSVFCEQVFSSGFAHCDPHPANVLIRGGHKGDPYKPLLVLLDHGLYKELPDQLRVDYASLWKALVLKDMAGVKFYCQKLNAGEMYSLLAAILTSRSWDDITSPDLGSLRAPSSQEDKTLIRSYAQRYYFEIVEILNSVPREMLLLLKMNDCLRHIDRELGAPVNSSLVTAEEAVKALLREELKAGAREGGRAGWGKKVWAWWEYVRCEARIKTYLAWLWAGSRVKRLPLWKGGGNGKEGETDKKGAVA